MNGNQWYYDFVDKCADADKDVVIANGMPEHARYLIQKLFNVAESKVQLYSGCLKEKDGDVLVFAHQELIEEALKFIEKRCTKLEILVECDIDGGVQSNAFIQALKANESYGDSVDLKAVAEYKMSNHVAISDAKRFRFETDDEKVAAIANFGNPQRAYDYSKVFSSIFSKSTPIAV